MARVAPLFVLALASVVSTTASAQSEVFFANGFEPTLPAAPTVRVLRDDRVATIEMDYNADNAWGQFWTMTGSPDDDAGFLVTWWPVTANALEKTRSIAGNDAAGTCVNPDHFTAPVSPVTSKALDLPPGARWLVTANRRVQIQPLDNDRLYRVRVQRLSARGAITTQAAEIQFNGGDGTRVAALRASMSSFDEFNRPLGAADERLWNNANMVSTDPRFNLFFINDQYHAHTLTGTKADNVGDKAQTAQRFRQRVRIPASGERRIVFDMDSPMSPRSVWYLDLNPMSTDLSGHASFFDEEGALGLPAGILRLRSQFQSFSVSIVDMQGASHKIADVDMEAVGRQAITNVRRNFDVRVSTSHVRVLIDGRQVIDADFAPYSLPAGDYEPLWLGLGYNTVKDDVPYFLLHWDNFGFDGPVVDAREVHNYVTRIEGTDYRKASRGNSEIPVFTVKIPDNLMPTVANQTAEAWLVYTYQMGDYSYITVGPNDYIEVNGGARLTPPQPRNNTVPLNVDANSWGVPHTARVKIGDIRQGSASPLLMGDNTFKFFLENSGILNVHVEVSYPQGSAPAYTEPQAIHHFPLHAELPRLGTPARLTFVGDAEVGDAQLLDADPRVSLPATGVVPLNIEVGNASWANWAPQLMHHPVQSNEVWSTGGTAGIAKIDVYLRRVGVTGPGDVVLTLNTAVDAPAPQGRYRLNLDTRQFANGEYELFVQAVSPSGLKSHPSYAHVGYRFDAANFSGAYYPIPIRIQNP